MQIIPADRDQPAIRELEQNTGETLSDCYQCGKCTAGCPASMDSPPNVIMLLLQFGKFDQALNSASIWACMGCLTCAERCPKNVSPAAIIEGLKRLNLQNMQPQAAPNSLGAEFMTQSTQQAVVSGFRQFV